MWSSSSLLGGELTNNKKKRHCMVNKWTIKSPYRACILTGKLVLVNPILTSNIREFWCTFAGETVIVVYEIWKLGI